jgi:hypothetical protein
MAQDGRLIDNLVKVIGVGIALAGFFWGIYTYSSTRRLELENMN